MIARKENKEYTVDVNTKDVYLNDGYDIYDDKGKVIEYSPKKQVSIAEFMALKKEKEKLEQELISLKKTTEEVEGKGKKNTQKSSKKVTTEEVEVPEDTEEKGETDAEVQE